LNGGVRNAFLHKIIIKKMFSRLQKMEMKATNKNVLTDKERR